MSSQSVLPYGMRVWLGYRHADYISRRDKFVQQLASIFVPATVQQMGPLGLTAYLPMVLPNTDFRLPDEIALVIYPEPAVYQSAKSETPAGRAYAALHGPYFNFRGTDGHPRSTSSFPKPWGGSGGELEFGTAYALCGNRVNWHEGSTSVLIIERPPSSDQNSFLSTIQDTLRTIVFTPSGNSECIVQVNESFAIVWEHVGDSGASAVVIDELLLAVSGANVIRSQSQIVYVPSVFYAPDLGVEIEENVLLDVRERYA